MSETLSPYLSILDYYDGHLRRHGDTAAGAAWPNDQDRARRFEVMMGLFREPADTSQPLVICDLACGTGEFLRHLRDHRGGDIRYIGADLSALALSHARRKFPDAEWVEIDVLKATDEQLESLRCDYLVANGLFTVRHDLSREAMWSFLTSTLDRLWPLVRRGLAFNVMSSIVDWQRDDLFHCSYDEIAGYLHQLAGRHLQIRADYGLYEFTAYAYKTLPGSHKLASPHPAPPSVIPAFRPQLPMADAILPYLRQIDQNRWYSNQGPLVMTLQRRLTEAMQLKSGAAAVTSSGTSALVGGILACAGRAHPDRPYALCPSYTFVGTISALEHCGYIPYLVDIDEQSMLLEASALPEHPMLSQVGLVMPVATYGKPVAVAPWQDFKRSCDIPVVIDGAAAFEAMIDDSARYCGNIPVALSFHATKIFGCGEGGCLVTTDIEITAKAVQALNFGFLATRECQMANTNGKISEYHAAVALAELDAWRAKRAAFIEVADCYRQAFQRVGLDSSFVGSPVIASNYVLYRTVDHDQTLHMQRELLARKIESRLWYGLGVHHQPYYRAAARDELPVSEDLAPRLLGLPVAADLPASAIDRIVDVIKSCVGA